MGARRLSRLISARCASISASEACASASVSVPSLTRCFISFSNACKDASIPSQVLLSSLPLDDVSPNRFSK